RGRAAAGDGMFGPAIGGEGALQFVNFLAMGIEQRVLLQRRAKLFQFFGAVAILLSIRRSLDRRAAGNGGLDWRSSWSHGFLTVLCILPANVIVVASNANPQARNVDSEEAS